MPQIEQIQIFLASPGDVQAEREQARKVIEELNRTLARDKGVHLEVVGWDTDAFPSYGGDAQSIVNRQIADMGKYDLFIGIMWNRFGQPTPRAGSGTEEEFDRAVAAYQQDGRPDIMFYFSQEPSNLTSDDQAEQKMKVLRFKRKVQGGGLTWNYDSVEEFRNLLHGHLASWLIERKKETPHPPAAAQSAQLTSHDRPTALPEPEHSDNPHAWIFLNNAFFKTQSVKVGGNNNVLIRIAPSDAQEESLLRSLRPQQSQHVGPVGYAYQNEAAITKVQTVEMESVNGKTVFIITLKPDDRTQGSMYDGVSFNGVSADEIAELRARLLLLNELPANHRKNDPLSIIHFVRGMDGPVKVE
ncbi:MAG: DUF4062 domain-containing protein, partial [Abitibacteriaceae bacterium]|nr:DUF4062 domain-containing protein [Abditibacteriaceae bacterium]